MCDTNHTNTNNFNVIRVRLGGKVRGNCMVGVTRAAISVTVGR